MGAAMARLPPQQDAERYRLGYPGQKEKELPDMKDNVNFYTGIMRSRGGIGGGEFIDKIHTDWFGDYNRLECDHGYIQWLFPIREPGMNPHSEPLTAYEIEEMLPDPEVRARLLKSYRLILDFYGMRLVDESTGAVARKEIGWEECYGNLNQSPHNYLRITRILKCLGELGLAHFQAPLCDMFVKEVFVDKKLPHLKESLAVYWVHVVKDDEQRARLVAECKQYMPEAYDDDDQGAGEQNVPNAYKEHDQGASDSDGGLEVSEGAARPS